LYLERDVQMELAMHRQLACLAERLRAPRELALERSLSGVDVSVLL
jgi:hypothetical protein